MAMSKLTLGVAWMRAELAVRRSGAHAGRRPLVFGSAPQIAVDGRLRLGDSVVLRDGPTIDVKHGGELTIGDHVFLNRRCNLLATTSVAIGAHGKIAPDAVIRDTDTHQIEPGTEPNAQPIHLGRNVWIGQRAIVLPGVTIGDNAVVAAGAVVVSDVPANTVAAGVPAKVVRTFDPPPPGWVRQ
jgi:acetyltransferase-like isoleucine patch superfamily enzyme